MAQQQPPEISLRIGKRKKEEELPSGWEVEAQSLPDGWQVESVGDVDAQPEPQESTLSRGISGFLKTQPVHPVAAAQSVMDASKWFNDQVIPFLTGIGPAPQMPESIAAFMSSREGISREAVEAFKSGDIATGSIKTLYWLMPGIGDMLNAAAQRGQSGDVAGGFGETVGALTNLLPFGRAQADAGVPAPRRANPRADVAAYADARGIDLTAGERSGSDVLKMLGDLQEKTSLSAEHIGSKRRLARDARFMQVGREEAANLSDAAMTPETAGLTAEGVVSGVRSDVGSAFQRTAQKIAGRVSADSQTRLSSMKAVRSSLDEGVAALKATADQEYDAVRQLESLPENQQSITTMVPSEMKTSAGQPAAMVPVTQQVGFPVNLQADNIKGALRAVLSEVDANPAWTLPRKQQSAGYNALQQLVSGPDTVSLSQADRMLSALKALARKEGGVAKLAVSKLESAVQKTLDNAPPEVRQHLTAGRQAVKDRIAKQEVIAAVFGKKNGREVGAFRKLLASDDVELGLVKSVLKESPGMKSVLGRGLLDYATRDLLDESGKLSLAKVRRAAGEWAKVGTNVKSELYAADTIRDVDRFFEYAERAAREQVGGRTLPDEGVKAFKALVQNNDASAGQLRSIAKINPELMPKLARAWLDSHLDDAVTIDEKVNRGAWLKAEWDKLGDETKRLMFGDNVHNLDKYFQLASDISFAGNTSRTAYYLHMVSPAGLTGLRFVLSGGIEGLAIAAGTEFTQASIARLLWDQRTAKAITDALQTPRSNQPKARALTAKIMNAARAMNVVAEPSRSADVIKPMASHERQDTAQPVSPPSQFEIEQVAQ